MYQGQEQLGNVNMLSERLRQDASGELVASLVDELRQAEQQIRVSLQKTESPREGQTLKALLEATNLSEQTIVEVWEQIHQRTAPV